MTPPQHPLIIVACALAACAMSACADVGPDPRAAWLASTLVDDNRIWLDREPALVELKFRRMANDRYAYLRGTAGQFWRDAARPDDGVGRSAFATAEGALVRTVGDAHPENLGTFRTPSGTLMLAFNDFDAADFRPWYLDVRRQALAWWVACDLAREDGSVDASTCAQVVEAGARGYAQAIMALERGEDPGDTLADRSHGAIADDLFRRARRDGDAREELLDYTTLDGSGARVMRLATVEAPVDGIPSDETRQLSPRDEAAARALVSMWRTSLRDPERWPDDGFRVLGVSERLGAGVSSFPNRRWYVLLDGPTPDVGDDVLIELRETVDPPLLGAFAPLLATRFDNNGQRVVAHQRALQHRDDADALLGWGRDGATSFRVRERTKYQKGFDVVRLREKLAEGAWDGDDLVAFAELSGHILARHHALAPDARGVAGLGAISDALGGDVEGFAAETRAYVDAEHRRFDDDYGAFVAMLESSGPLLGYRAAPTHTASSP